MILFSFKILSPGYLMYFSIILILFQSIQAQIYYIDENTKTLKNDGSYDKPFSSLSEFFDYNLTYNNNLYFQSNIFCNDSFINDFGLSI